MCKNFNVHDLPDWLVSTIHSDAGVYQLTELFVLYSEEKTMEKYYEMLCKGLIEKNKNLFEQILRESSLKTTLNFKSRVDSFEGE